jgi:hypothetical protein
MNLPPDTEQERASGEADTLRSILELAVALLVEPAGNVPTADVIRRARAVLDRSGPGTQGRAVEVLGPRFHVVRNPDCYVVKEQDRHVADFTFWGEANAYADWRNGTNDPVEKLRDAIEDVAGHADNVERNLAQIRQTVHKARGY